MPFVARICHWERGPVYLHKLMPNYVSYSMALMHLKLIYRNIYQDGTGFRDRIQSLMAPCRTVEQINQVIEQQWYDQRYRLYIVEVSDFDLLTIE